MAHSRRAARAAAMHGVDALLSRDGRHGRIRELDDQGCPVLLLTHWQSLFSDGTCAGLWGLEQLLMRLQNVWSRNAVVAVVLEDVYGVVTTNYSARLALDTRARR
jgi:hypothetical protein